MLSKFNTHHTYPLTSTYEKRKEKAGQAGKSIFLKAILAFIFPVLPYTPVAQRRRCLSSVHQHV